MAEETSSEEKINSVTKANIGDKIKISKGVEKGRTGKVVALRENSVIAEIGMNVKKDEPIKTVVNHKNYKIVH
jgi:uncharacterized protein YkvS